MGSRCARPTRQDEAKPLDIPLDSLTPSLSFPFFVLQGPAWKLLALVLLVAVAPVHLPGMVPPPPPDDLLPGREQEVQEPEGGNSKAQQPSLPGPLRRLLKAAFGGPALSEAAAEWGGGEFSRGHLEALLGLLQPVEGDR